VGPGYRIIALLPFAHMLILQLIETPHSYIVAAFI